MRPHPENSPNFQGEPVCHASLAMTGAKDAQNDMKNSISYNIVCQC